jgi:hypothetical protein
MCGRFTQSYTWRELVELYELTQPALNLRPRYNIAPTTSIDVVRSADTGPELVPMRWGLIPGWWKKTVKEVPSTFNARAETVAQKPMFRSAFKRTRCIVPASGYYEWRTIDKTKQPYFISAADGAEGDEAVEPVSRFLLASPSRLLELDAQVQKISTELFEGHNCVLDPRITGHNLVPFGCPSVNKVSIIDKRL